MFESDADRLAMLTGMGEPVSGPRGQLYGLLEREYVGVGEVPIDSDAPRLTVRSADVTRCAIVGGSLVYIDGEAYTVRSLQADGAGMTVLVLEAP